MEKVLVAFSGGLDTSFCVKYLKEEKKMEVHTALVNTGGFSESELSAIALKAAELGSASHVNIDVTQEYFDKCIRYMIYGNILKNGTYPLSVSSERAFQAIAIVEYAKKIGAKHIAHGSTGAGNDQVRFDLIFQVIAPETGVITPIRDLAISRQEEIELLKKYGYDFPWTKAKYSINQGLWGTSVGGVETLKSDGELPEEAYPTQVTKSGSEKVHVEFEKGQPVALNGKKMPPVALIRELRSLAAPYGVGRDTHVGDTIIGIKGRVGFEAAAPLILIKAHHLLEKHVLTKWQLYWKEQLANWYGMLLHEAQYLEPVMRDIEKFLESTQQNVSGSVEVKLQPYHFSVVGCKSNHDLMSSKFGEYGEINRAFTGSDVKGFTNILSMQMKIYGGVNGGELRVKS
ncbi:MAG: argininosuccinate synthase [Prevotellaceae bacterium]|jgi:argininosuccinate synthase|nr:argininosuccinate synthase [Prevotellaceae bacterium]